MKILLILLVTVLYQSQNANCNPFLDYMSEKLNEFANTVVITIKGIKDKVKRFLQDQIIDDATSSHVGHSVNDNKINKAFSDFVEKTAAESETEGLEYLNFKSEPTALMSTPQLATLHGRRVQSHVIHTKDGYLLTLHRITSNPENNSKLTNQTVLLHHGLLGSSADWILLGPEKSLPYLLSNIGYDVWMANARGNYYSRGHVSRKIDSAEFWKFSWQEIGEYDLPATIDYIRKIKNTSEPINYIGHSMGATALLVMLSIAPQYNEYLRIGILLAPLVYMTNIEGPIKVLTTMASSPPEQLLKMIGSGEFLPTRKIPKWLAVKYCKGPRIYCNNPLFFLSGGIPQENIWNSSFVARLLYHVPAGGSTNTILHYAQVVKSGKFHKFDDVYTEFPLSKVTVPMVLFSSSQDWLATIPDILRLYFSITNPIDHYVIRDKNISHTEFVWGSEANNIIFNKVIEYLETGSNWNMIKTNEVINYVL